MFQKNPTQVVTLVRKSRIAQIAVALVGILLVAGITVLYNVKTINANIDGKQVCIRTLYGTVGQALEHSSKIEFYPEDIVSPSIDTKVTNGMAVNVQSSVPVNLSVDGQIFNTRTAKETVGEALSELSERYKLEIKDVDEVNVALSESVTDNMDIQVLRSIPIKVSADGKK